MMMVMMMMTLLVGDAGVFARRISGRVVRREVGGALALGPGADPIIVTVTGLVQSLLATEGRVIRLRACTLVKIRPGLTVVSVQSSPALRRTAVETRHGVAVRRGPVTIVLAASLAVPSENEEEHEQLSTYKL